MKTHSSYEALEGNTEAKSDYDKSMMEAMHKIAVSCGRKFAVDVGYEDLPELVHDLIELHKPKSAIKPKRTKVEYEKCEFNHAWEALKAFEDGDELYRDKNQTLQTEVVEFIKAASVGGIGYILTYYKADNLYRRIETPIEWWEDAKACHDSFKICFGSQRFHRNEDNDTITIAGEYTRDQLCDLARELLEQGE